MVRLDLGETMERLATMFVVAVQRGNKLMASAETFCRGRHVVDEGRHVVDDGLVYEDCGTESMGDKDRRRFTESPPSHGAIDQEAAA